MKVMGYTLLAYIAATLAADRLWLSGRKGRPHGATDGPIGNPFGNGH